MSSSSYAGGVGSGESRDYSDYFVLPAAPAQRSLWFVCQLNPPSNAAYNVVSAVRLTGELDLVLLQQAVNAVVARHESLRTGVGLVDGDPHQLVLPEALVSLPVVDCADLSAEAAEARVQRLAREQAALPFALDAPPLLRLVLVREAPRRHTMIVTIHHLVCDSWSMDVFYADLAAAYRGLRERGRAGFGDLPVQYADYVGWLDEQLAGEQMERMTAHWQRALAGTTPLELPVDRPRDQGRGGDGGRVEERLDGTTTAALEELAKRSGGTLFMVLLTGFMATLARVTGQEDVVVGTPVAGRHHPDAEQLVGFFANTLVLRARLPLRGGFESAAGVVRDACLGAFSHDRMPFDRLVQEMRQTRALDRNPLFDVMFSMPNTPAAEVPLPGLTMAPVELTGTAAKFDLWLTVLPDGDGLRLQLDYDRGLYDAATAARIVELHRQVLADALRDPSVPVGALPLAAAPVPAQTPAVPAPAAVPVTVSELLARRGAEDAVLSSADAVLTLGELREWAADLAGRLRAEGIAGPGMRVTTPPVPSAGLIAVLLAVFEVGAVPAYGQRHDRAGAFVRRAEEEPGGWVITTGPRFDPVPDPGTPGPEATAWSAGDGGPEGSGAAVSHGALAAALAGVAERLSVTAEDDVLLLDGGAPPSPVDLLMPLAHARSLMLSGVQLAPAGPPAAFVLADPPTWRRVLTEGWEPPPGARLVCVGEVLAPDLVDMLTRTGRTVFLGRPGPQAAAMPAALAPLDERRGRRLGPPPAGVVRSLLDVRGMPVSGGLVGELHVADGTGTAVPVGLRCRRARDGALEAVGPGEGRLFVGDRAVPAAAVERVLAGFPGVGAAAVTTDPGASRLIAWLVPDGSVAAGTGPEREAFAADIRGRARSALPGYRVPAVFGVLDELPEAPGGGPDRGALPAPPAPAPREPVAEVAPRNGVERRVLAIFQDVLGLSVVGVHGDFFGLGGHSLLAAKLLSRVRAEFGLQVPVRDFFRLPTPAGLAAAIEELERARDRRPTSDEALLAQLAGMSDDEIDQLLRHMN
ncbi:condensation domain-containing protein [Streptomyces sp. NBC_01498]|uniref:condensation domain-containing protein n=1 Tax=Streptomyces sp. NBC_01498 TaxID=2975870 RepID=UPI002E7BE30B|nr:condensation domain-containing protein [Streptomyces sp. NBC_01498]WTL28373.1 condensation domain-containing protein [Streptomyces sp. NBC_01498]